MNRFNRVAAGIWDHVRPGPMTLGARRGLLYLLVLVLAVIGGAYALSASAVTELHAEIRTQCAADQDIGNLAHGHLMVNPQTGKPPKILVAFIGHSRAAFYGLQCPGTLRPPTPVFVRWAREYGIPYR